MAEQVKMLVSPVNMATSNSSYTIYSNISEFIANDIINELNKNIRFSVYDLNSAENLIISQGIYEDYRGFLKNYKDRGIIDYRLCRILNNKIGIDKLLLVSSAFSLQNMIMKQSLLFKIGVTEAEPVKSFYQLNSEIAMLDTQTCIVDFKNNFNTLIKAVDFEVPTNSISDNIVSTGKIKEFSKRISDEVALQVFAQTSASAYTRVNSNVVSTTNVQTDTREGTMTRDGRFYSTNNDAAVNNYSTNNDLLKKNRMDSFKSWAKEKANFYFP